jgi:hypothetical protein
MITNQIVLGLLWSYLLGLFLLGVLLSWLEQYQTLHLWLFIPLGLLVVLSMPGVLILGAHLA